MDIGYAPGNYLVIVTIRIKNPSSSDTYRTIVAHATVDESAPSCEDFVEASTGLTQSQIDEAVFMYVGPNYTDDVSKIHELFVEHSPSSDSPIIESKYLCLIDHNHTLYDALCSLGESLSATAITNFTYKAL